MKYLAIDFDGTCVLHDFPETGKEVPGAVTALKYLERRYHLLLYTMRCGKYLEEATQWFQTNDITLYGIQYNPNQAQWTSSNKCYAHYYIDDAAVGCPTIYKHNIHNRRYVDWPKVIDWLKSHDHDLK